MNTNISLTTDPENNPQVCAALREEIELYHSKRVEILDNKNKIKSVRRKGMPSIKVIYIIVVQKKLFFIYNYPLPTNHNKL